MNEEEGQNISMTLFASQIEYLDKLSTKKDLNRSQVLRMVIRFYQENNEEDK